MTKQALHNKAKLFMVLHGHSRVFGCWTQETGFDGPLNCKYYQKHKGCQPYDNEKYYYRGIDKDTNKEYTICIRWLDNENE